MLIPGRVCATGGAFRTWNPSQTVSGYLCHSSFDISLLSWHLPITFRTSSMQHSLCLQNSAQIFLKGRCLKNLQRFNWQWKEKSFYCYKILSSYRHTSSFSKSQLGTLTVCLLFFLLPSLSISPLCFPLVDALWDWWVYEKGCE